MGRLAAALLAFALGSAIFAQGSPETITRLVEEGKQRNRTIETLRTICEKFGPRLTGSPNLDRATLWAVEEFKRYGLQNVRREQWGEVPVGFARGKRQSMRILKPWPQEVIYSTPAWTPGTPGKVKVKPVLEPATLAELEQKKEQLKGAWVVMRRQTGIRGPLGQVTEVEKAMENVEVAGRIYGAADERVHTGGRFLGLTNETLPKSVTVRVRKSDYRSMFVALQTGRELEMEIDIDNQFIHRPMPQYNVIADLVGTEKPDEIVVICGHFDSWDGPGSKGANDNGTGSSVTLEAARLLAISGAKPKRTIRFILWTGEEQGLLGSRAYVEKYKSEMDKISAVFNDDGGTNYQGGYTCLENMKPILEAAMAPSQAAFPDLPTRLNVVPQMPRGGSSDHAPFVWAGVPGFFTMETGRADYGFVWHTQNDRPEHSIEEYLTQSSTNAAIVAYNVACAPTLLPRVPLVSDGNASANLRPAGGSKIFFDPSHEHRHDDDHDHDDEYVDYVLDTVLRWLGILGR